MAIRRHLNNCRYTSVDLCAMVLTTNFAISGDWCSALLCVLATSIINVVIARLLHLTGGKQ